MKVKYLDSESIDEFINYCNQYGPEHDESFLPEEDFKPDENNPTYILVDSNGKIVGASSLMMSSQYKRMKKARFRIFHSVVGNQFAYQQLLDAIAIHLNGIENIYLFVPQQNKTVLEIFKSLAFEVIRYSFYMERNKGEYKEFHFPTGMHLEPLRKGINEETWCAIYNQCFSPSQGHVDITKDTVFKMFQEQGHIEDGMLILWNDNEPIGTIRITKDEREGEDFAFISDVGILYSYRGNGLGRNLIRAGIQFGKIKGLMKSSLVVNSENIKAANLYLNEGFEKKVVILCLNKRLG